MALFKSVQILSTERDGVLVWYARDNLALIEIGLTRSALSLGGDKKNFIPQALVDGQARKFPGARERTRIMRIIYSDRMSLVPQNLTRV